MLSKENIVGNYLDISVLEEGVEYSKVCYLERMLPKVSQVDTGFYTLVLKDINAATIVGNLWFKDAGENFINSGISANHLKRQPVTARFKVEVYNGSLFLKISEVKSYNEKNFPFTKFMGAVADVETLFRSTCKAIGNALGLENNMVEPSKSILNEDYMNDSLPQVYNGLCGGYVKLLQMVFYDLISYEGLPNINLRELVAIFYAVQDRYYRYLKRENVDIITDSDKLDFIYNCGDITGGTNGKIIKGTLGALTGCFKPDYLYAILISESFRKNMRVLNMCNTYTTMVKGMKKEMGDLCLVKV